MNDIEGAVKLYKEAVEADIAFLSEEDRELVRDVIYNFVSLRASFRSGDCVLNKCDESSIEPGDRRTYPPTVLVGGAAEKLPSDRTTGIGLGHRLRVPTDIRDKLRVECASQFGRRDCFKAAVDAYIKGQVLDKIRPRTPDRFMITLMHRILSLKEDDQAELFEIFVSLISSHFPWLDCFELRFTKPCLSDSARLPRKKA